MSRVSIHARPSKGGRKESLYLEFNPPISDHRGTHVRRRSLNLERYINPDTDEQKQYNRFINEAVEKIICKTNMSLLIREYDFLGDPMLEDDFLEYFELNGDCHGEKYISSRKHFENFCKGHCSFKDIKASLCDRFRMYLLSAKGLYHKKNCLNRNTASAYYSAFLSVVQMAYKDHILKEDCTMNAKTIPWNHDRLREFLSKAEIKQLDSIPYDRYPEVHDASMLAIETGLRRSDILALQWENVIECKGRKKHLLIQIHKTGAMLDIPLTRRAVKALGTMKKSGKVFPHLTKAILTTHVPKWLHSAKIWKHITFHCFRHTFAMQLLNKGVSIYVIAKLLGHKNVANTQIYARMTPEMVLEAIYKMDND